MFLEVHTWIFVQLIFVEAVSSIFVSCLPKSWWKMLSLSWSMSGKYSTVGYLSICFFQCASYLLGRNFEHSSRSSNIDQVTFKMPLSQKMPWQWRKSFSPKRPFLPLVLIKNNNNKHAEYHGIFILFKGQIYWKQGSHISLLFGTWTFRIISFHVWVKPRFLLLIQPDKLRWRSRFARTHSYHAYQESGQGNICSFHQEKVTFLSSYLLSAQKKNLVTRKIMPIQNISLVCQKNVLNSCICHRVDI